MAMRRLHQCLMQIGLRSYLLRARLAFRLIGVLAAVGCAPAALAEVQIRGAGATFAGPVYTAWATAYERSTGIRIAYENLALGAELEGLRAHQVDFIASDTPQLIEELDKAKLRQFPAVIGAVVPIVNIAGIRPGQLKLSGPVLANIYLGHIRKWNDAAIKELNPTLRLPNTNITVVHRSDSSGSTLLWTGYLAHSSDLWRSEVGVSLTPKWPTGVGGFGNAGVASSVQRTRFAIGYADYFYVRQHRLSDVSLRNRSGHFVRATQESLRAVVASADWNAALVYQQLRVDPPGAANWPMTHTSFILIGRSAPTQGHTTEAARFFCWALGPGASIARKLHFVPVASAVVPNCLKVPIAALFRCESQWCVFVVDGNRARRRQVQISHRNAFEAEVVTGLTEGQYVVRHPSNELDEGSRVSPFG